MTLLTSGPYDLTEPVFIPHREIKTAIILGAGFSCCAGVPSQENMLKAFLSNDFSGPQDLMITQSIKQFLKAVFGWTDGDDLPALEDIFTMIDLSAGSGHNLGKALAPRALRAIRRMLIDRIFAIIDRKFIASPDIEDLIKRYLPLNLPVTTHFVVLNWDNVLERHLHSYVPKILAVDYRVRGKYWPGDYEFGPKFISIAKVHGSSGWLYCDNCKTLFYYQYDPVSQDVSFCTRLEDIELLDKTFAGALRSAAHGAPYHYGPFKMSFDRDNTELSQILPQQQRHLQNCRICGYPVGPHIATFSFRKSFRTHASALSWQAAEEILSDAAKWIFIGYSLPDADIEFKHLIKTCQLKFAHDDSRRKSIDIVVKDDEQAEKRYRRFFGPDNVTICQGGLKCYLKGHFGHSHE